jgi:hypothetical protein
MKFAVFFFCMVAGVTAWGQGTSPVQKPGPFAAWKIAYTALPPKPGAVPLPPSPVARPAEVTYTVTGGTVLIETRFDNGTSRTLYLVGGEELSRNSQTKRIRWVQTGDGDSADAACRTVFPGFAWVSEKYLVGKAAVGGHPCLHYKFVPEAVAEDEAIPVREAWVSVETGRPVAFIEGTRRGEYRFLDAPKNPIEIPREFLEYREARMRRAH